MRVFKRPLAPAKQFAFASSSSRSADTAAVRVCDRARGGGIDGREVIGKE